MSGKDGRETRPWEPGSRTASSASTRWRSRLTPCRPTSPESDGTFAWEKTTLVLVEATAGGKTGLGYSYADTATAALIRDSLADVVRGRDAMAVPGAWSAMVAAIRNLGRPGVASMAISAVDSALWDLKARLLDLPLVTLLGAVRDAAPVYGSGGFTSYSVEQLREQLGGWVAAGIPRVKMKIGTHPADDLGRVRAAREAIGPDAELFVDANGAYSRKQALAQAERFAELGVSWFEEPVSSDDLDGLRLLRDRGPAGMDIAAGEYGYDLVLLPPDARGRGGGRPPGRRHALRRDHRLPARRGPVRGALRCRSRPTARRRCTPTRRAALPSFRHLEYFHDHVRIEHMLFDGALTPVGGALRPDLSRPGLGLEFKHGRHQRRGGPAPAGRGRPPQRVHRVDHGRRRRARSSSWPASGRVSILVDTDTRLCMSGITGREGTFHSLRNRDYGTQVVAGVTPGKGGQDVEGIPVFNTFHDAVEKEGANTAMIFVPPRFAADSILEAEDAGIELIICITEGIPAHDELRVYNTMKKNGRARLVGPNCPGILSPGKANVGIIPASFFSEGNVGVVSRSGTLTYQIGNVLAQSGFGNSSIVGIGGDPVPGTDFIDIIGMFQEDAETELIVMCGEIGGDAEERAAEFIAEHVTKPVVGYIAGFTAPPGKTMGHAGAIVSGSARHRGGQGRGAGGQGRQGRPHAHRRSPRPAVAAARAP